MKEENIIINNFEELINKIYLDFKIEDKQINYYLKGKKALSFDLIKYTKREDTEDLSSLYEDFYDEFTEAFKTKFKNEIETGDLIIYTEASQLPIYESLKKIDELKNIIEYVIPNNPKLAQEWHEGENGSSIFDWFEEKCFNIIDNNTNLSKEEYRIWRSEVLYMEQHDPINEQYPMPIIINHKRQNWDEFMEEYNSTPLNTYGGVFTKIIIGEIILT